MKQVKKKHIYKNKYLPIYFVFTPYPHHCDAFHKIHYFLWVFWNFENDSLKSSFSLQKLEWWILAGGQSTPYSLITEKLLAWLRSPSLHKKIYLVIHSYFGLWDGLETFQQPFI